MKDHKWDTSSFVRLTTVREQRDIEAMEIVLRLKEVFEDPNLSNVESIKKASKMIKEFLG